METITLDKKEYVVIPKKEYEALQIKAALRVKPSRLLTSEEARAYSKKLIRQWASEK